MRSDVISNPDSWNSATAKACPAQLGQAARSSSATITALNPSCFPVSARIEPNLVDLLGSQFAVGLGSLNRPDSAVRIWVLLNSTERELFAQVHESVCARIPLTVTTRASLDVPKEWSRYIWSMTAPINSQLAGVDHWLRYRDDQDIQAWCRFLLPLVPTLHDRARARGLATGGAA